MSIDMPFFLLCLFSPSFLYPCYTFVEGIGYEKRSEYVRLHAVGDFDAEECHSTLDDLSHVLCQHKA